MRYSTLVVGAFAAGAFATPLLGKRDYVTEVDATITVTQTQTAGYDSEPTATSTTCTESQNSPTPEVEAVQVNQNYGGAKHGNGRGHHHKRPTSVVVEAVEPTPTPYGEENTESAPQGNSQQSTDTAPAGKDYKSQCLYHHNIHRSNHSAPDVTWSDALAATAQKIASTCHFGHSMDVDGGKYGQNIAAGVPADRIGEVISDQFYNNELLLFPSNAYGSPDAPGNFEKWGHFSQVVWKATTEIGCATVDCTGSGMTGSGATPYYTVCNYKSAGNMGGAYGENIGSPLGHPYCSGKSS